MVVKVRGANDINIISDSKIEPGRIAFLQPFNVYFLRNLEKGRITNVENEKKRTDTIFDSKIEK